MQSYINRLIRRYRRHVPAETLRAVAQYAVESLRDEGVTKLTDYARMRLRAAVRGYVLSLRPTPHASVRKRRKAA